MDENERGNRLEALRLLIDGKAFAPSHAALAKELGYKGKMVIYRLADEKEPKGPVDKVWELAKQKFHLDDNDMHRLASTFSCAKHYYGKLESAVDKDSEAWVESLIVPLVTDAYGDFPDTFKAKTMPELVDLKTDEPDIYWGMVTLAYLRATNTDIYGEGAEGASRRIITELNSLLAGLYPEKAAAREAADNLLDLPAPRNLWGLLTYCTALFRHYAESNYKSEASKELLLLGCGKRSYWLEPDCDYKPGRDVWLLTEQSLGRMTNGYYFVLRLRAGGDTLTFTLEDVLALEFYAVSNGDDTPMALVRRRNGGAYESFMYAYGYDSEARELYFEPFADVENVPGLPATLRMVSLDNYKGVYGNEWAYILARWDSEQGRTFFMKAKEAFSGFKDMAGTYTIVDVSISKTALTLAVEHDGGTHEYRLPVDGHGFLAEINPSQNVTVARHEADGCLYALWPELGYSVKLSTFEKIRE